MKPLFVLVATATAVFLFGSFTPKRKYRPLPPPQTQQFKTAYYFYFTSNDSFDQYAQLSTEIAHLEDIYDAEVDSNPFGGTLIVDGYSNNILPHNVWPVSLYTH